jgi:hypothetical protein
LLTLHDVLNSPQNLHSSARQSSFCKTMSKA